MKNFALLSFVFLAVTACQKPQYFDSSPEIDLVKKGNQAYVDQDWETLRSLFADTAKAAVNQWAPDKWMTVDQLIEAFKADRENVTEVKISDDAIYNMIINNEGNKYVLAWFNWTGKMKNGKEVSTPVHLVFQFAGGKVAFHAAIFDNLPGYMALQPSDSTVTR